MCDSCESWPAPACECIRFGRVSGPRGAGWGAVGEGGGGLVLLWWGSLACSSSLDVLFLLFFYCTLFWYNPALCFLLFFFLFFFFITLRRSGQEELFHPVTMRSNSMNAISLEMFLWISGCYHNFSVSLIVFLWWLKLSIHTHYIFDEFCDCQNNQLFLVSLICLFVCRCEATKSLSDQVHQK